MLAEMRARRKDDGGFTLIELMVVVLIIGILVAIAIPSFFNAREAADAAAVKSNLRNAITLAKTWYAQKGTYTGFVLNVPASGGDTALYAAGVRVIGTPGATIKFQAVSGTIGCALEDTGSALVWSGTDCGGPSPYATVSV